MEYNDFVFVDDDEYQDEIDFIMTLRGDEIDSWWGNLAPEEQERAQGLIRMAEELLKMEQTMNTRPVCQVMPESRSRH